MEDEAFVSLGNILLPAYLVLAWLMLWYLTIIYYKFTSGKEITEDLQIKWFLGWLIIWILFAVLYIFVK